MSTNPLSFHVLVIKLKDAIGSMQVLPFDINSARLTAKKPLRFIHGNIFLIFIYVKTKELVFLSLAARHIPCSSGRHRP